MTASVSAIHQRVLTYLRRDFGADLTAGLTGAIAGVPQAMAFALVAGISPVYGLYTAIVSTIIGSLFGNSTYLTTGPTNALAVVVASTLAPFSDLGDTPSRLITLTFLVGAVQLVMGLLRLGMLTRYVSGAVMVGFITGAAMLVLLGQLTNLTGIHIGPQPNILATLVELLREFEAIHLPTLVIGLSALVMIALLHHTRLGPFATLVSIIVTSIWVALLSWDDQGVAVVREISTIPNALPAIRLPRPGMVDDLLPSAIALAVLGLVQTAALVESLKEPDNRRPNASREFIGQGAANLIGALFQNMPAGGSLSRTAVNMSAGARTRWANVWAGVFVALTMLAFGGLAERIALAALAGQLIYVAWSMISIPRVRFVWRSGAASRWAMVATFASTMVLPLQYSVYVGVVLSLALYVHESSHIRMVCWEPAGNGLFREVPVPQRLPSNTVTILSVQGNLFFAAMRELQTRLPSPIGAQNAVVILRLRGDALLAGTGVSMLLAYADQLHAEGGKLILSGVGEQVMQTLIRTGALTRIGPENVFLAEDILLLSTTRALTYANQWLDERRQPAVAEV